MTDKIEVAQDKLTEAMLADGPAQSGDVVFSDEQIKHMVNRFLGWKLPNNFHPDNGISFKPTFNDEYNAAQGKPPQYHNPSGTNLFCAQQAEAMVRHMVGELPTSRQSGDAAMTSAKDAEIAALQAELAEARNECLEQARLLGMSAERELDLQARLAEARGMSETMRHWAWGHIDALLLYSAGTYPKDSHVKDAVAFCRALYPRKKLRMDPLEASSFHPAAAAIEARDWSK